MPIRIGPFDPLKLIFQVMDTLMRKDYITYEEARRIIREALPPEMSEEEKENILNSLVKRTSDRRPNNDT